MKANFIHTWRLESEFGIKNLIFPWTSELAWIWHFFEKIWFFLIALALATLWQNLFQTYGGLSFVEKTLRRQFCNQMLPVQERSKRAKFSQKMPKFMLTLMSKEKLNFSLQIQILHFKYVWNLPSLSLAWFFLIQNELRTMCPGRKPNGPDFRNIKTAISWLTNITLTKIILVKFMILIDMYLWLHGSSPRNC